MSTSKTYQKAISRRWPSIETRKHNQRVVDELANCSAVDAEDPLLDLKLFILGRAVADVRQKLTEADVLGIYSLYSLDFNNEDGLPHLLLDTESLPAEWGIDSFNIYLNPDVFDDLTPTSGDTETSKTKSQQTDASVPDAGSALERTPSMIPAFEGALNRESFAKWFVELREGMGLNQRELAQVTGHSKSFIARIETGEAPLEKGFEVLGKLGICVGASFFPSQAPEPNTN